MQSLNCASIVCVCSVLLSKNGIPKKKATLLKKSGENGGQIQSKNVNKAVDTKNKTENKPIRARFWTWFLRSRHRQSIIIVVYHYYYLSDISQEISEDRRVKNWQFLL